MFDPEKVERYHGAALEILPSRESICEDEPLVVSASDYDQLLDLYRQEKKAFQLSIAERRVDQHFDNGCEEYDHWLNLAKDTL